MKVRIGVGLGTTTGEPEALAGIVEPMVAHGFDSLWLSEVLTGGVTDPLVALAWLGGRYPGLKLGPTMLLPGRNPLRLAKELATLDRLSGGRLLLTLVPGLTQAPEAGAIGLPGKDRAAAIDETLPLLRRLWAGETVTWQGQGIDLTDVRLHPLPLQQPLEPWLGGMAPAALRRCGRLADGWLPSLCTPEEARAGREVIDAAAAEAGRQVDPEHFGVSVGYRHSPVDDRVRAAIARRARGNRVEDVLPVGLPALRELLERYIDVGFTKFVVRPLEEPDDWDHELAQLAKAVGDLQS
jgi:probable F420-dependent oxidoreductase